MSVASTFERQMLELINAERTSRGLGALTLEKRLNDASEDHSTWMDDTLNFSHTGIGGSDPGDRMRDAGFVFSGNWTWGENIAYQSERGAAGISDDVVDLHNALMNSPGHRANILNPNFELIGIGIEEGDGRGFDAVYVTQKFARTTAAVELDLPTAPVDDPAPGDGPITGSTGNDSLAGSLGSDELRGRNGNDTIMAQGGDDTVFGGGGADMAMGQNGSDRILGGGGNDELRGGNGHDKIFGQVGKDTLFGGNGNDLLKGGSGADKLIGGAGRDRLDGGDGNDKMTGGDGGDTFTFSAGRDVVTDFDLTQAGERIDLRGVASITGFADLQANHIRLSGSSAVIDDGVGNLMVLSGIDPNMLQEGDFLF